MMTLTGPTITIITATFNVAEALATTAASIRRQTYPRVQWIVVDGASTDGTIATIREHSDVISDWISEPDRGIYDAWNKACAMIAGDWVLFIGAGDELSASDALERCVPHLAAAEGRHEIVYGMIDLVSETGDTIIRLGRPWDELAGQWGGLLPQLPPHPSSFHHRSMFSGARPFDASFRYAGDTAFTVESVLRTPPLFIPVVIDRMLAGGVSVRPSNMLRVALERRAIARILRARPPLLHAIAWYVSVAAQFGVHALLPAPLRRRAGRAARAAGRAWRGARR